MACFRKNVYYLNLNKLFAYYDLILFRSFTMSLLKVTFNMLNHCNEVVENCWKLMWRREVMNGVNMSNAEKVGDLRATWRVSVGGESECRSRADRGEWEEQWRRERRDKWRSYNMWRFLIDCLDLSHFNYLNSIISLQMIFFFGKWIK